MNLPEKTYSQKELTRAKTKGKVVGWLQGGGVVLVGAILWNLMGSVPVIIGLVAVGWVLWKLMSRPKSQEEEES